MRALLACCCLVVITCCLVRSQAGCEGGRRPVIVVGLDGLGSEYLTDHAMLTYAPNLAGLFANGASTVDAETFIPVLSLPNWAALLLGTSPSVTGIVDNDFGDSAAVVARCTTLLDAIERRNGMTTSMYLNWAPLTYLKGRANTTVDIVDGSGNVVDAFLNSKRLTNFTFIHVGVIDEAGHQFGWGGAEYYDAVKVADNLIGGILRRAARSDAIVVTVSDHGGSGDVHDVNAAEARRVPIGFWSSRAWDVHRQQLASVRNLADVAATIAHVMGVPRPAHWTGSSAAGDIFACDPGALLLEQSRRRSCNLGSHQ
ncbi:hypothetical protein PBRA_007663 [Plasmodiophora brassicae]|uniref:Uncharacterized protein n=1 Tax=Plasmodiophora brassicae TaxID=37360 RepID=A0A0G4IXR3_PLABS|nr:secrectory protein [Plasmodiophora brassicae]CEO99929.1 hypothetical protein PBRA_007663 [Plasmodiophora brassicae]